MCRVGQNCIYLRYEKGMHRMWPFICRVGQNYTFIGITLYIRHFKQGNHHTYGHIRCRYTVLANPIYLAAVCTVYGRLFGCRINTVYIRFWAPLYMWQDALCSIQRRTSVLHTLQVSLYTSHAWKCLCKHARISNKRVDCSSTASPFCAANLNYNAMPGAFRNGALCAHRPKP